VFTKYFGKNIPQGNAGIIFQLKIFDTPHLPGETWFTGQKGQNNCV